MKKEDLLFTVKNCDAQSFAQDILGRELTEEELSDVKRYLKWAFEDWGTVLHNAIKEIAEPVEEFEDNA